jgi:hypothetical protein
VGNENGRQVLPWMPKNGRQLLPWIHLGDPLAPTSRNLYSTLCIK